MPKLPNEYDIDYKRRVIDTKSASFCGAKWYNATIWLGSGQTTSCHHPPAHSIDVSVIKFNPKAIHNTPQKKQDRRMMINGERPDGCEYCWKLEDAQTASDRVQKTVLYSDHDLDRAYQTDPEQDIDLQTLEIAFDRTCQFACSYCNPAFSTTWARDIKRNGPYENLVSDGRNHFTHTHDHSQLYTIHETNPYVEAFFQWWETDLHRTLKELRITGGEPLMSGYTWKLLDWFKHNRGKSLTRLAINSNLGVEKALLEKLLNDTQDIELDIYTSNESTANHAEYIRDGLDYHQWYSNLVWLLDTGKLRGLHVMCTINALCLVSLTEFLTNLISLKHRYGKEKISFTLNILRFPSFQSPLLLPQDIKNNICVKLVDFVNRNNLYLQEFEIEHVDRLITYLKNVDSPHSQALSREILQRDFKNFYQQYDQRRGKDFRKTFSELTKWYDTL